MTMVQSVSIPVADQDRALAFYVDVLGCELRTDVEVWPGARFVEVVPPGSRVGLVLLPPDSEIPMFFFADPDGNGLVYLEEEQPPSVDN
jgi:catechol 2,3-dioxygenase-like lactoylglutathione lyase family enzyme